MRYLATITALLALSALAGIMAGAQEGDGVRRLTPLEARDLVVQGKAIIVDVRGADSYKAGHIKGARWIQIGDIESHLKDLPRDKMIITYCS